MAPRGGYRGGVDKRAEWVRLDIDTDAEGKLTARAMGQDYWVWINDAIEHHVYRCELLMAQERYSADEMESRSRNSHTPNKYDPRYQVTRKKPEITRMPEQGSGRDRRSPRP
jgi:hypothetical protein